MGVYLVTWKLNPEREGHDSALAAFIERLERYDYIHNEDFERVYFISTPLTAGQINVDLHAGLDPDDQIIVAHLVAHTYCGWLPQVMWDWIEERLPPADSPADAASAAAATAPPSSGSAG